MLIQNGVFQHFLHICVFFCLCNKYQEQVYKCIQREIRKNRPSTFISAELFGSIGRLTANVLVLDTGTDGVRPRLNCICNEIRNGTREMKTIEYKNNSLYQHYIPY